MRFEHFCLKPSKQIFINFPDRIVLCCPLISTHVPVFLDFVELNLLFGHVIFVEARNSIDWATHFSELTHLQMFLVLSKGKQVFAAVVLTLMVDPLHDLGGEDGGGVAKLGVAGGAFHLSTFRLKPQSVPEKYKYAALVMLVNKKRMLVDRSSHLHVVHTK